MEMNLDPVTACFMVFFVTIGMIGIIVAINCLKKCKKKKDV